MMSNPLLTFVGKASASYSAKVLSYSPIAYWPQWEASGSVAYCLVNPAQNGAYTGVMLGQPGIGDGRTCPYYDGLTDYTNIYTAALAAAISVTQGTMLVWWKVNDVGVWTDGVDRVPLSIGNGANFFFMQKDSAPNNQFRFGWTGTIAARTVLRGGEASVGWNTAAMTWDSVADEYIAYWNGVQEGAIQVGIGNLGALANGRCNIGARITAAPTSPFHGWGAQGVLFDRALLPAEIADLVIV